MLKSGGCGLAGERQRQRAAAAASCRRATAASLWSAVSLRKARLCEWRLPARSAVLCVCFGSAVSRAVERGWLCCVRCVIHAAVLCGCVSCAVGYPAVLCVCCDKASYKGACVLPSDCRWGSRFPRGGHGGQRGPWRQKGGPWARCVLAVGRRLHVLRFGAINRRPQRTKIGLPGFVPPCAAARRYTSPGTKTGEAELSPVKLAEVGEEAFGARAEVIDQAGRRDRERRPRRGQGEGGTCGWRRRRLQDQ